MDVAEVLTFGEPMGLMVADEVKPLKDVEHFSRYVCGAEVNFSVGLSRLGHEVAYISQVGPDPFGEHIRDFSSLYNRQSICRGCIALRVFLLRLQILVQFFLFSVHTFSCISECV